MARVSVKAAANTAESRGRQAATISRQARIDIPAGRLIAAIVGPVAQPDPGFGASSAPTGLPIRSVPAPAIYTARATRHRISTGGPPGATGSQPARMIFARLA